jgi:hypothetical protein
VVRSTTPVCMACSEKYGKTFKVSVGSRRIIVTADPKVARHVTSHAMNRNLMPSMRVDDGTLFFQHGLFGARYACSQWGTGAACNSPPVHLPNPYPDAASYNREEKWHTLRPAWQPAFQITSLEAYADCIMTAQSGLQSSCAQRQTPGAAQCSQRGSARNHHSAHWAAFGGVRFCCLTPPCLPRHTPATHFILIITSTSAVT